MVEFAYSILKGIEKMKKCFILLLLTIWGGGNLIANGLSFGGTRAMQWWTDQAVPIGDLRFQIVSVHVQNTNQATAAAINRVLMAGWRIHTHYMHGDFLVFLLVKD